MRFAGLALFVVSWGVIATVAIVAIRLTGWRSPERWNPWASLAIADPPGPWTRWKLDQLERDPAACHAALSAGDVRFQPVPEQKTAPGCGTTDAVRVERVDRVATAPFVLACPAAVALAVWERHTVQPAAEAAFGEPVVRLEHLGSYACRNIDGRTDGRRSDHATANALDVAGFVLRSGRRVRLAGDWSAAASDGPREPPPARFLRDARDGACAVFGSVLGPDYNAAHRDHFHLDRGRYRICR